MQSESREEIIEEAAKFRVEWLKANHWRSEQGESTADFAIQYSNRENDRLIQLLTDIRFALGDDGKRMQDELVEYCKEVKAERDRLRVDLIKIRDFLKTQPVEIFGSDGDEGGSWPIRDEFIYHINKTLDSKAGSGVEE